MAVRCQAFSDRLLLLVQEIGLNNRMFAKTIGISENAATNYLKKGRLPEPDILVKISNRLGRSLDWLLQDLKAEKEDRIHCVTTAPEMIQLESDGGESTEIAMIRDDSFLRCDDDFSGDEKRIIRIYRKLDAGNRQSVSGYLTDLLSGQDGG